MKTIIRACLYAALCCQSLFPSLAQTLLVRENLYLKPFFCTSLSEKPEKWPKDRDLYTESTFWMQKRVQARFVHGEETKRGEIAEISVMFWNVENFFDWRNDSTTVSDVEFSSRGERHWTWKKFQAKANAFAKALFWVEGETGQLPDIVGLAEVENSFVLRQVLQKTALRKTDYRYVHYDSPDRRGIDVALLYRSSVLELVDSKPCHLYAGTDSVMTTRDILSCTFRKESSKFAVLVNHHPSKYGGAAESEPRRRIAVERLRFLADSLASAGIDRIIACGDFNDTPDNPVFHLLEPSLVPMHMDLHRRGLGTIKYEGKWDLIDHFYVSPVFFGRVDSPGDSIDEKEENENTGKRLRMRILRIPFLLTRDTAHSGERPLRTYLGPRYTGGVSDHLPILLETELPP
jgi:endonuclease/exonuclease/phosphatase family metal-dependent hydrolase